MIRPLVLAAAPLPLTDLDGRPRFGERRTRLAYAEAPEPETVTAEEAIAARELSEHRRGDWLAGRLAIRTAAAAALGASPADLLIEGGGSTAPSVRRRTPGGSFAESRLNVSVSHRDRFAVAVADPTSRIGVDLELAGFLGPETRRYFLTPAERSTPLETTTLWALKEAAWKAMQCAASTRFAALELGFGARGTLTSVTLAGDSRPAAAAIWAPRPGYIAAVVWLDEVRA